VSAGRMGPEEPRDRVGVPEERAEGPGPARRELVAAAVGGTVYLVGLGSEWVGVVGLARAAPAVEGPAEAVVTTLAGQEEMIRARRCRYRPERTSGLVVGTER
jgi:hypothetical protein